MLYTYVKYMYIQHIYIYTYTNLCMSLDRWSPIVKISPRLPTALRRTASDPPKRGMKDEVDPSRARDFW